MCSKEVRQVGVRGLQVFEAKRRLRVDEQNPQGRRRYADAFFCSQREERRAAGSSVAATGGTAQQSTAQLLTSVPDVVKQHVGAGHEEEPVQGNEYQTKDVQSEGSADENHADHLQKQRRHWRYWKRCLLMRVSSVAIISQCHKEGDFAKCKG